MNKIKLSDKEFQLFIHSSEIYKAITKLAAEINNRFKNKNVLFLGILNGAFMFASELLKEITFPCEISFLKLASYQGTSSTGTVKRLIGVNENMKNKTVIILEDIIDSGETINDIVKQLKGYEPKEIVVTSMISTRTKWGRFINDFRTSLLGFNLENVFRERLG